MRNMILTAAVLVSGLFGGFLLYLAEKHVTEASGDLEANGAGKEERISGLWSEKKRALLIGCIILCGGAIAAFRESFYHDTVLNTVNILLLCSVLWASAWADLRAKLIPNSVLIYGLLLRCVMLTAELILLPQEVMLDLVRSVIAAVVLFAAAILCRLAVPGAVGFGDVKLLMLMGFFLETDRVWACVFLAMLMSFVYSLVLLMTKRANMKTEIPYAPFLFLGTVTAAFLVSV